MPLGALRIAGHCRCRTMRHVGCRHLRHKSHSGMAAARPPRRFPCSCSCSAPSRSFAKPPGRPGRRRTARRRAALRLIDHNGNKGHLSTKKLAPRCRGANIWNTEAKNLDGAFSNLVWFRKAPRTFVFCILQRTKPEDKITLFGMRFFLGEGLLARGRDARGASNLFKQTQTKP